MLYYRQKENGYKEEVDDDSKKIMGTLFVVSIIVTLIGLGFAVYNYYVFDKPFMTTTTKGLLAAFFLCATMVAISLSKSNKK